MDLQSLTEDELRALCVDPDSKPEVLRQIADEFPDLAELAKAQLAWNEAGPETIEAKIASEPSPIPPPAESPVSEEGAPAESPASVPSPPAETPASVPSPPASASDSPTPPPVTEAVPPPPEAGMVPPLPLGAGAVPPPPPPPPYPAAPATPAWLAVFGKTVGATWRRMVAIVGISLGAGLFSAAVVVLVAIAFPTIIPAMSSGWAAVSRSLSPGLVMQLMLAALSMAHLATLDIHFNQDALFGSGLGDTVSVFLVPWLVTTLIVGAAWVSARKLGPQDLTRGYRLGWAGLVGLAYTVAATILSALVPVFYIVDRAAVNATAVGFWPFICGWILVAGGTFAGLSRTGLTFLRRPWVAATVSGLGFVAVGSVISVVVVGVILAFSSPQYLGLLLWVGPIAGWWMVAMGMGASAGTSGVRTSGYLPNSYSYAIWSGQLPAWLWLVLLVTLALVILAGVFSAGLSRPDVRTWYRLPVAWVGVGLLFEVLVSLVFVQRGSESVSTMWAGVAPYTFLLMGVWAALAAVGAHFVAPYLLQFLPRALRAGLAPAGPPPAMAAMPPMHGVPTMPMTSAVPPPSVVVPMPPETTSAEDAPAAGVFVEETKVYEDGDLETETVMINTSPSQWTPAPVPTVAAGSVPLVPMVPVPSAGDLVMTSVAVPEPPKMSTRAKVAVFSGLGALALLIVVIAGAAWAKSSYFSPQDKVMQFMSALQAGRAGQAAQLANLNTNQPLLTDAVYSAATDRPNQAAVSSATVTGDTAVVTVSYTRAGRAESATFSLNRTGTDWLIMDRWEIVDGAPMSTMGVHWPAAMGARTLVVNNVEIPNLNGSEQSFTVFPGSYNVALKADANFEGDQDRWSSSDDETVFFQAKPTPALQQAMIAAVRAKVNECARSTMAYPSDCPFAVAWNATSATSYSGVSYRIIVQPTMTVSGATEEGDGWEVGTSGGSQGTVSMNYTWASLFSNQAYTDQRRTFTVNAVVVIENGAPVVRSLSGTTGY